ncbi:MAG: Zn-ribbon domain-containing OB-fold protein [Acidimicrobiia bacterium]
MTDSTATTEPATTEPAVPFRILPALTDLNREFWTAGARGELRFLRCNACGYYNHPPTAMCPVCHSKDLAPHTVSGRATLHTYTVNHQAWMPGPELPYVIAIVEFPEQEGLRLTTNVVNCALEDLAIGMPMRVTFEHHTDGEDEIYIPLFEPGA